MKNIFLILCLFFLLVHTVEAKNIGSNTLNIGNPNDTENVNVNMKTFRMRSNEETGEGEFSHNGDPFKKFGSGSGTGDGSINLLLNPSFEDGSPTEIEEWTNTGGTLTQQDFISFVEGDEKYASFTSSAIGQFVESTLVSATDSFPVGSSARFRYKSTGAFDYGVYDAANILLVSGTAGISVDWRNASFLEFPTVYLPSQTKLRITSLTASGTIQFNKAFLGSSNSFLTTNNIKIAFISLKCATTAASPTPYSACTVQESSNDGLLVQSGTDSIFTVTRDAYVTLTAQNDATCNNCGSRAVFDKNNDDNFLGGGVGDFIHLSQPETTTGIRQYATTGTFFVTPNDKIWCSPNGFATGNGQCTVTAISVNKEEAVFTPEQADFYINVSIGGNAPVQGSSGSPIAVVSTSWDMVLNKGAASIPCSGTNPPTGLICAVGSENLGVNFNAPVSGNYKVCASFLTNESNQFAVRWVETPSNAQTILQQGAAVQGSGSTGNTSKRLCEFFKLNVGNKTLRVFQESTAGFQVEASRTIYSRDINITVELVSHNVSRPIIQNMVDTKAPNGTTKGVCHIINTGAASFDSTDPDCWFLESVNRASLGTVNVDFISLGFKCGTTGLTGDRMVGITDSISGPLATAQLPKLVRVLNYNHLGALVDDSFSISCSINR